MAIERFERLTDLVAFLLDVREGATLDDIANAVPGYPEGDEARRGAFERDKRVLRDEGIPLKEEKGRYWIPPDEYYLPDLGLTPEEQLAVRVAVTAVRVGGDAAGSALDKLTLGVAENPEAGAAVVADLDEHPVLPVLHAALRARAEVTFTYRGERRTVEPTLVWFRDGNWYLAAHDRLRGAERNFRVDRIDGDVEVGEPGSSTAAGTRPPSEAPMARQPWLLPGGEPATAVVDVDAVLAAKAVLEAGPEAVVDRHADGSVTLSLPVTHRDAFRTWLLGLLDHAVLQEPADLRAEIVGWLEAIAAGPADVPRRKADLGPRLRRVLAMVPWLLVQGDSTVSAVAERFGMSEDDVVRELNLVMCCGVPPYGGGDLITIFLDDDGTISAWPGPYLARPMQLTPREGFAVLTAGRALLAVPGAERDGALASAMAKLEAALGDEGRLAIELDAPPLLAGVRAAVDAHHRLRITYYSAWRDELADRTIEPWTVYASDGRWYVDAHDLERGEERRFRVDRIRELHDTGEPFDPPAEVGPPERTFTPGPEAERVRLRLPESASWVTEDFDVTELGDNDDGTFDVTVMAAGVPWLERLLLRAGPAARVLSPESMQDIGPAAARRLLAGYR